jgi:CubicO group peptidase (beta-lactamase class C family)
MRRFALFLISTLLMPLWAASARADALDDLVRAQMHRQHIPGLAFGVLKNGRLVRAGGYGFANLEWHVPATPDTVFSLHSVSKQFTAAGILLLVERGKVGLDDPVSRYFNGTPEAWKGITVRHLLTHTSGLPDYLNGLGLNLPDDATDEDTVRALMKLPLDAAPGEKWAYCNTGYLMLGLIIRKASGVSATDFLRQNIFAPLGMTSSRAVSQTDVIPRRASKYVWKGGRWINAEFPFETEQISDSKMLSTVHDLARWDAALTSGRILSHQSRQAMWTPVRLNDGKTADYGFGWFLDAWQGHRRTYHMGASFNGNRTYITRFPDDGLSVIVLTNGGTPVFKDLANGIAGFYVPALKPKG